MKCPKCDGTNVTFEREQGDTIGSSVGSGRGKMRGNKLKGTGLQISSSTVQHKTTALCHDCGYAWGIKSEQDENDAKTAKGCLTICGMVLLVVIVMVACSMFSSPNKASASSQLAVTLWKSESTPVSDFTYDLRDGVIYLQKYNDKAELVRIAAQYEVDGTKLPVSLEEMSFMSSTKVKSVVFEEGITSLNHSIFNSTEIERIYIPSSMSLIYDSTLAYIDRSLAEIDFARSEEEWNTVLQPYVAGSVGDNIDSGNYEGAGEALADKLNSTIGHSLNLSTKTVRFNIPIESLN